MDDHILLVHTFDVQSPAVKDHQHFSGAQLDGILTVAHDTPVSFEKDLPVSVDFHVKGSRSGSQQRKGLLSLWLHGFTSPWHSMAVYAERNIKITANISCNG